jgi:hypothetical protein
MTKRDGIARNAGLGLEARGFVTIEQRLSTRRGGRSFLRRRTLGSFLLSMASPIDAPQGDPKPKGFMDDIVAAILNPGYIGSASMVIINVALVLVIVFISIRIFSDPRGLSEIENSIHLFALIPCIGLLVTINWYNYMVGSIRAAEAREAANKEQSKKKKDKKKKVE